MLLHAGRSARLTAAREGVAPSGSGFYPTSGPLCQGSGRYGPGGYGIWPVMSPVSVRAGSNTKEPG